MKIYSESNFIPVTIGISKNKSRYKRRIIMISKFRKSKWTNTLLAMVLITSVGLTALTGCKKSTDKEPDSSTTAISNAPSNAENKSAGESPAAKQETKNQSNTNTEKPAQNTTTKTNENKEAFYGDWVIKKVLAYGPVGTYSKDAAESLIGKSLSFSKDKANFFGDQPSDINEVAVNPVYKKSVISKGDFVTNYRIDLDKLGVKADSVSEITVSDSSGVVCTFLVKDENTLIIFGGGTYFELVRKAG
jgi:hypothetical protein